MSLRLRLRLALGFLLSTCVLAIFAADLAWGLVACVVLAVVVGIGAVAFFDLWDEARREAEYRSLLESEFPRHGFCVVEARGADVVPLRRPPKGAA